MGYDNNNAGMHMIHWPSSKKELQYYDEWAERHEEQERIAEVVRKSRFVEKQKAQKNEYDRRLSEIRRFSVNSVYRTYQNIAYYSHKNGINLIKTIDDINSFLEQHVDEYEDLDEYARFIYSNGLLAQKLEIEPHEFFIVNELNNCTLAL